MLMSGGCGETVGHVYIWVHFRPSSRRVSLCNGTKVSQPVGVLSPGSRAEERVHGSRGIAMMIVESPLYLLWYCGWFCLLSLIVPPSSIPPQQHAIGCDEELAGICFKKKKQAKQNKKQLQ